MHFVYLTRKGHVPAQALSVVYGSVQVSVYFIINMAFFAQTYQLQNETDKCTSPVPGNCETTRSCIFCQLF